MEEEDENITGNGKLSQSDPQDTDQVGKKSFERPQKRSRPERNSPPMSPKPCNEEECNQEEKEDKEPESASPPKRGVLYASQVVPAGRPALEMLTWIMAKMSESEVETVAPHRREFLYVVRKGDTLGGYERIKHEPDQYKGRMPSSRNGKLYLLEPLGHGDHGRVYRAMSRNLNLCVLKFFVKKQSHVDAQGGEVELASDKVAEKAAEYWNKAYHNWLPRATHGKWGGGDAIVMPDLEKMSTTVDLRQVLKGLEHTMRSRFFNKGIWHCDPAWRNVALVRDTHGNITRVCMIDLEPQRMTEWVAGTRKNFTAMWNDFKHSLEQNWDAFVRAESNE